MGNSFEGNKKIGICRCNVVGFDQIGSLYPPFEFGNGGTNQFAELALAHFGIVIFIIGAIVIRNNAALISRCFRFVVFVILVIGSGGDHSSSLVKPAKDVFYAVICIRC